MVYHGRMVMFWYIECISHGGEKHGVVHISWGRKAHLVWKFPDVCPEVVADVVAEPDVMLSGEDHVESRHFRTWSYDKIALRVIGTDIDTEADFIERERLLSVVLVVLMQLLKKIPSSLAGYLINGRFPFILRQEKSLGLEDGARSQTRGQGPVTGGRTQTCGQGDLGPRGRNPDPGGRDLEDGSWRNNLTFFIGLYKLHRSITLPCRSFSDALALGAGVGRKFDGEAGNISIKDDASNHTPGACAAFVAILGLSSGRALWFHESCGGVYGSVPRNSERENLGEAKDQENEEAE
ncbi:hypothetical protein F2Q70_00043184 [Brassica cretica]|uniref:Uncharacterized protein n=1 Tax=Brassica cretica TaxID=69181 RepID=A0A8S9KHJ3_BRACR|nr:hypothetical protein F2Q70_00043184 [Brassica cretica]